jgi:ferredoxin-NADP reductase/predicted heme/steroid binding protein
MSQLEETRYINAEELKAHDGREGRPCWVGYQGKVYDVSTSELFVEGKHYWVYAGQDLTEYMPLAPHLDDVLEPFPMVGYLAEDARGAVQAAREEATASPADNLWRATLLKYEDLTRSVRRFFFSRPEGFSFRSGQYVRLHIPQPEGKDAVRSYSLANSGLEPGSLEWVVEYRDRGIASTHLFDRLSVGDEVAFSGPYGRFVLPEGLVRQDVCLVTSGVGITSARPLVHDLLRQRRSFRHVELIYGALYASQLLFDTEWKALAQRFRQFAYRPVLLRDSLHLKDRAQGRPDALLTEFVRSRRGPGAQYYLCGWGEEVQHHKKILAEEGLSKAQWHTEIYT